MISARSITGLVLAGGRGLRMGGVDKGLVVLRGYPMAMHVIMRLAPQVGCIIINANQNADVYQDMGYPVVADTFDGFAGPLAGLHAGMCAASTEWLASVPCDAPLLPSDLVARLAAGVVRDQAELAVACTQGRPQPVFCLVRASLAPRLEQFLKDGGRKVEAWLTTLRVAAVAFDDATDAFANVNTEQELARLQGS
jgi:molybdenum cofactor guanylyltransferase